MNNEQLKDLLEIIIEKTYNIPYDDIQLKQYYPDQPNKSHIAMVTIYPVESKFFSRNYLEIKIYTLSETRRSEVETFKLYDSYYYKTITRTISNKKRLLQSQKYLKFKEAVNNTIPSLLDE